MKQGTLGSISHATLREEDLIEAFSSTLEELVEGDEYKDLLANVERIIGLKLWNSDDEDELLDVQDCLQDLELALQNAAPSYCYFGAHEGDGSDFGFWIEYNSIEEALHTGDLIKVSDLSEIPEGCSKPVIVINDHGNISLYQPKTVFELEWDSV